MSNPYRSSAAPVVVPLRRRRTRKAKPAAPRTPIQALVPSGRTIVALFVALTAVVGLYAVARSSSLFEIREVEVYGVPPALSRQIGTEAKPFEGRSLVGLDRAGVERAILSIPDVKAVRIDRDFPNTLRIFAERELHVAVLRSGNRAWLVAASDKVVREIPLGRAFGLPRVWQPQSLAVTVGEPIADLELHKAIDVLARLRRMRGEIVVTNVITDDDTLTLVASSRIQLRFGDASRAALKLAVVEKTLPLVEAPHSGFISYLDVSLPERPVSGTEPIDRVKRGTYAADSGTGQEGPTGENASERSIE